MPLRQVLLGQPKAIAETMPAADAEKDAAVAGGDEGAAAAVETGATINIGYVVPKDDADRVQGVITSTPSG